MRAVSRRTRVRAHDVQFVQAALRLPNPALLEELALAEGQTVEDHAVVEQFVARHLDGSEGGEGPEFDTKGDRGPVALYGQVEASEDLGVRVSLVSQPERQAGGGLLEEQKTQGVSNADRKRSLQVDFRGHRVTAEPDRAHPEGDAFTDPEGDSHAAVVAVVHLRLDVNGAKAVRPVQSTQAHQVVFKGARAEVGAVASPIDPQGACGDGQDERAARRPCADQPPELGIGEGLVAHEVDRGNLLAGGLGGQRQGHGKSTQGHSQSGGHDRRRRVASVNELDRLHRLKSPLIPDPFEERLTGTRRGICGFPPAESARRPGNKDTPWLRSPILQPGSG